MTWESWFLFPVFFLNYIFTVVQTREQFCNFFSVAEHLHEDVRGTSQLTLVV